jgi:quercetin dioxygenase-like cupin family protein
MMNRINISLIAAILVIVISMGCHEATDKNSSADQSSIFPKKQPAPAEYFTGNAWVTGLVDNDSVFTTAVGNVFFEARARSNWHLHPCGQILLVTSGVGYHQIKGQPIEIIRKGDVVKCPPDVLHWHGASKDSSMSHIYILPNTEKGMVEWKEPVTDEEYSNLN